MDEKTRVHKWLAEGLSKTEIARRLNIPRTTLYDKVARWEREGGFIIPPKPQKSATAKEVLKSERRLRDIAEKRKVTEKKYKALLEEVEEKDILLEAVEKLGRKPKRLAIKKTEPSGSSEATIVALFSDWHIEEEVVPETVNFTNEYNLEISRKRAEECFTTLLDLTNIENRNTTIKHVVIAILGDMISSDIHLDTSKSALLEPIDALLRCREYIYSGIHYLLDNSDYKFTVVCHTGNHGRKDKEFLIANEIGASLEYFLYRFLAEDFKDEKRIRFHTPRSYHSYLEIYDWTVRFHHGHFLRFSGGVGGLTIPANKAIAQWNKTGLVADIDCFGHFHQAFDSGYGAGNFVANGSLIGFSPYAISVKGGFQKPMQMIFGIHSKRGKYFTRPILFSV